jgi:hypothetical protein
VEAVKGPLVEQVDGVHLQVQLLQALQPAELVLPQLSQVAEEKSTISQNWSFNRN